MYRPKCGVLMNDTENVCHKCGYVNDNIIDGECTEETVKEETVKEETININENKYNNTEEIQLGNIAKVFLVAITVLIGGIGPIVGIISGIVLMNKPYQDYRSFGKILVILGIVFLSISLLCCCLGGILDTFAYYIRYNF